MTTKPFIYRDLFVPFRLNKPNLENSVDLPTHDRGRVPYAPLLHTESPSGDSSIG